ncbi:MAG TPA: fused MFS/spermidine synthase [Acidimicrobiia bacterium]|nr:fused MFS/spermidine synthase [Acidimicrobiia bacterium]
MPKSVAAALVFACSAAVLVLEILASRLLAPYVGVSLDTYTAVIGTILAGIAAGAWLGGLAADRIDPRRLLGPLVVAGGGLALFTVPVVRGLGDASGQGGSTATVFLALAGFFLPAAVLSSVTPIVAKLQLQDLGKTGGVFGRLSGIGTLGALVGTFVTGFLLVARAPTRGVIFGLGATLVLAGIGLWVWLSRRDAAVLSCLAIATVGTGGLAVVVDDPCQIESAYYCMRVEHDPARASGRILWLDDLRHSYVDLDDPSYLEFDYLKSVHDVVEVALPDQPIDALFIGGGGFTLPRALAAERPGTRTIVLEIDPAVVDLAEDELGLETSEALEVRVGDARIGIRNAPTDGFDLVVGDAFASLSVPWHLTTREFLDEVRRVLRPDGVYVVNVIDYPPFRFARAELATFRAQFDFVAVIGSPFQLDRGVGGNLVLVAADDPANTAALEALVAEHGDTVLVGAALDAFIGSAPELTDDYAPVDQWLVRDRPA